MRALLLALVLAACSGSEPPVVPPDVNRLPPQCIPGQQAMCSCVGGAQGAQVCQPDGTYGACACPDASTLDAPTTPPDTPAEDRADVPAREDTIDAGALDATPGDVVLEASGADAPTDAPAACDATCNGVCMDLRFNVDNCGACGVRCIPTAPHTRAQCFVGRCEYPCETGYGECDGRASNGCETPLRTNDRNNCGNCRAMCNATETCVMGVCRPL